VAALVVSAALGVAAKIVYFDHLLQTQASEWRSVPLSDGSSITAAPNTKLHHDFDDDQRFISLEEGRVMFRVAKDQSRPFLVQAGGVIIRATGTQFGVESDDESVTVTMREGTVVVKPAQDSEAKFEELSLGINQQLVVTRVGSPTVMQVDAERVTQWAQGTVLLSDGNTVGDAVAQFNDFNEVKIDVDEQTGARQMRGRFDAIDPLSFADTVGKTAQASVVRESPERIRIKQRERRR
jgi:transmembrane sensor